MLVIICTFVPTMVVYPLSALLLPNFFMATCMCVARALVMLLLLSVTDYCVFYSCFGQMIYREKGVVRISF